MWNSIEFHIFYSSFFAIQNDVINKASPINKSPKSSPAFEKAPFVKVLNAKLCTTGITIEHIIEITETLLILQGHIPSPFSRSENIE